MSGHVVTVAVTEHTMLGIHQEIRVGAGEIVTLYLNPSPCSVAGRVLHLLTDAVLLHIHHHHLHHHDHHLTTTNTDRRSAHAGNACIKLILSSKYTTLPSSNFFNTRHKKIYFSHFTKSRFIIELRSRTTSLSNAPNIAHVRLVILAGIGFVKFCGRRFFSSTYIVISDYYKQFDQWLLQ